MSSGLFDTQGGVDPHLTGPESRILRAMLTLERRHIAILAEIVTGSDTTTERVTQWERSKDKGYPPALVVFLRDLVDEVTGMGHAMGGLTVTDADGRWTITRPLPASIRPLLCEVLERSLTTDEEKALEDGGGDFWQRLADVAVIEAARMGRDMDCAVHVEVQKT